jgi:hypothetical protein
MNNKHHVDPFESIISKAPPNNYFITDYCFFFVPSASDSHNILRLDCQVAGSGIVVRIKETKFKLIYLLAAYL